MAKKDIEIELEDMPVDNVGIMQGFLEMMGEDDDDYEDDDDEMEAGAILGRTPDSPEILMNNLRGDMRSIDARRDELADLVGYAAAAETPEPVLAMLQPVLAQQGIAAMMPPGPMPPGGISPVGMPNVPNMPNVPSEMMAPMEPMPAGGIGDMAPPVQMAKGGIVQRFSNGTTGPDARQDGGVSPATESSGFAVGPAQLALARQAVSAYLMPQTQAKAFDLATETAKQQQLLQSAMGADSSKELARTQMLLDLASRGFGYAANVDEQGRPLRGGALSRFAQATRTLPQTVGQFIAQQAKQDQAIKLAALQAAQKVEERDIATRQAQRKAGFDVALEILKEEAKKKNYEILSNDQARELGLPLDRGQVYQRERGTNDISPVGSPQTVIQMPGQRSDVKYAETVAAEGAKEDVELFNAARKAPANIEKHNKTIEQIQKSTTNTGFAAELINNINRVRAKILNDKKAGKEVTDTEILNTMLGSEVFTMLPALGIGARGMDTPAERQFLLEVMTGNISLDKNTLLKMAETRRNLEVRAIERFNDLVNSGELDSFFEARNRQKRTIEIPSLVPISAVGTAGDPRNDPAVDAALGGRR